MIPDVINIIAIGAAAGWVMSFLLRDRGTTSGKVVGAGVAGAAIGGIFQRMAGPDDLLMWAVTVLVGAMIASFGARLRLFAREA